MPDESKNSCPIPDDGRSKLKEHPNRLRLVIQLGFVVFSVFLCLQFRSFVLCLSGPTNEPVNSRPPAVEAYLPISSLMSLTYLVKTGVANRIHPAGLVIFTLTLILAVLVRRGFFIVLHHHRRRIVHFNVTANPTAQWTSQQITEAFPYDSAPKYLIRDRDKIFGNAFVKRVRTMQIEEVLIAPTSP